MSHESTKLPQHAGLEWLKEIPTPPRWVTYTALAIAAIVVPVIIASLVDDKPKTAYGVPVVEDLDPIPGEEIRARLSPQPSLKNWTEMTEDTTPPVSYVVTQPESQPPVYVPLDLAGMVNDSVRPDWNEKERYWEYNLYFVNPRTHERIANLVPNEPIPVPHCGIYIAGEYVICGPKTPPLPIRIRLPFGRPDIRQQWWSGWWANAQGNTTIEFVEPPTMEDFRWSIHLRILYEDGSPIDPVYLERSPAHIVMGTYGSSWAREEHVISSEEVTRGGILQIRLPNLVDEDGEPRQFRVHANLAYEHKL